MFCLQIHSRAKCIMNEKFCNFWRSVLWPEETKIELLGHNDVKYVFRRNGERNEPKNTLPIVKHGGGSIILWGCFSAAGFGSLIESKGL